MALAAQVDGGEEVARGLVVAGCDGAELLEFGEEVLDQVARPVEMAVVVVGADCGWPWAGSRRFCRPPPAAQ